MTRTTSWGRRGRLPRGRESRGGSLFGGPPRSVLTDGGRLGRLVDLNLDGAVDADELLGAEGRHDFANAAATRTQRHHLGDDVIRLDVSAGEEMENPSFSIQYGIFLISLLSYF